ncbi:uncharacterized protein LOC134233508 [Saccostrea cucullata]|uniref:uncharacterized protein LOC134233508 n=1 Tax=Saccostrea cuccullata TaxID=36930 RepID=UPI002ED47DA6
MFLTIAILGKLMNCFGYDNLSYGRSAVQSSTYTCFWFRGRNCTSSTYIASKAVDGYISTCTRTEYIGLNNAYDKVWWYVDLGGIRSVYDIRIRFKDYKDEHGNLYLTRQRKRLAGFSLYISNTSRREDGYLCYEDLSTLGLPDLDFSTRCIKYGRFVIFYNERMDQKFYSSSRYENPALTELCDVVVQGCYRTGVYGYSCDINCPTKCQGRRCDIVNGYCLGCTEGWSGSNCNQACPSGWYGLECKLSCSGNCRYSDICNHVTGRCDRGCASGWKGSHCNKLLKCKRVMLLFHLGQKFELWRCQ